MNRDYHSTWIHRRAACTPAAMFEQLAEIVRENVEVANTLEEKDRGHYLFFFQRIPGLRYPTFEVQRRKGKPPLAANGRKVVFANTPDGIRVGCPDHPDFPTGEFTARPVWDMETQACFLHIEQKPYRLPEVSELALWYLFFGTV